ncbi:MAG: RES family NAD+ phosphorylase [Propionibacteriaceae bacterium]|nr:RES family NAD+ phosphorylase [Propionibacteriaceae bacterium]
MTDPPPSSAGPTPSDPSEVEPASGSDLAQLGPADRDLTGFPSASLPPNRPLFRSHACDKDVWWFNGDLTGRFDLAQPQGTFYVADDIETAVRERLRHELVRTGLVPDGLAQAMAVTELTTGRRWRCAHLASAQAAGFGLTKELVTMSDYTVPQAWAQVFDRAGFQGLRYGSRFTTGPATAWALFGRAGSGQRPAPVVRRRWSGPEACRRAGLTVLGPPPAAALKLI